jgi:catechol 2,3-dioxygenase-like lactoylglutathione lyase family enzyme
MRIDHLNIVVSNMERSLAFYEGVLGLRRGFEAVLEGPWIEHATGLSGIHARCVFVEAPGDGVRFELLEYTAPRGEALAAQSIPNTIGLRHVAFVIDDMNALLARLRAAGIATMSDPVDVPFAVGTMGRKRLCYFRDPDGVLLEAAAYDGEPQG